MVKCHKRFLLKPAKLLYRDIYSECQKKTGVTAPVSTKINKHYYCMVNFCTDVLGPEIDLIKYNPLEKPSVFNW